VLGEELLLMMMQEPRGAYLAEWPTGVGEELLMLMMQEVLVLT